MRKPDDPRPERVRCEDCLHLRRAPEEAPYSGCWHPTHMVQRQSETFLKQQELPGDQRRINLRGDCADFERRPPRKTLWKRLLEMEF